MKIIPKWRKLIAGGMLMLLALTACQTIEPVETAVPTMPPEDAAPPPSPTPSPAQVKATDPPPLPFGLTGEEFAFRGDPNAPVVIIEFSDYQ